MSRWWVIFLVVPMNLAMAQYLTPEIKEELRLIASWREMDQWIKTQPDLLWPDQDEEQPYVAYFDNGHVYGISGSWLSPVWQTYVDDNTQQQLSMAYHDHWGLNKDQASQEAYIDDRQTQVQWVPKSMLARSEMAAYPTFLKEKFKRSAYYQQLDIPAHEIRLSDIDADSIAASVLMQYHLKKYLQTHHHSYFENFWVLLQAWKKDNTQPLMGMLKKGMPAYYAANVMAKRYPKSDLNLYWYTQDIQLELNQDWDIHAYWFDQPEVLGELMAAVLDRYTTMDWKQALLSSEHQSDQWIAMILGVTSTDMTLLDIQKTPDYQRLKNQAQTYLDDQARQGQQHYQDWLSKNALRLTLPQQVWHHQKQPVTYQQVFFLGEQVLYEQLKGAWQFEQGEWAIKSAPAVFSDQKIYVLLPAGIQLIVDGEPIEIYLKTQHSQPFQQLSLQAYDFTLTWEQPGRLMIDKGVIDIMTTP